MPSAADSPLPRPNRADRDGSAAILLGMVLVTATSGLVYELSMAAVASYLLGDSVTQFSLIIGIYLSAMGLGAYLSGQVERPLTRAFVDVELGAALLGGLSAPALFIAHATSSAFEFILYCNVVGVGILVGLELPLLLRILERRWAFKELVARALSFDYAGALLGSLAFSLFLVPRLGLVHTSLLCGLLNAGVALLSTYALKGTDSVVSLKAARARALITIAILIAAISQGHRVTELSDAAIYPGRVLYAEQSRYQRIVLTETGDSVALHLNGHLQFSSSDEARYHEALVHPALTLARARGQVFVGGGGDGLASREILKWPDVQSVTLVDLDERNDRARQDGAAPAHLEPELAPRSTSARRQPGCIVVLGPLAAAIRRADFRLSGSQQLFGGQAVLARILPRSAGSPGAGWRVGRAGDIAVVRASRVLVRGSHLAQPGFVDPALSRVRARVRRMGLRARRGAGRCRHPRTCPWQCSTTSTIASCPACSSSALT